MSNKTTRLLAMQVGIVMIIGFAILTIPAKAEERTFGHEASACLAWDIQLRYMLEQRNLQATFSAADGEVILDEIKHASRLCDIGRYRSALNRFAALFDLLSGEDDEREGQG